MLSRRWYSVNSSLDEGNFRIPSDRAHAFDDKLVFADHHDDGEGPHS
jgi:hypothetical protein